MIRMDTHVNPSIQCSVKTCANHCQDKEYCSLPEIKVGCCESSAHSCQETKCSSFQLGGGCH